MFFFFCFLLEFVACSGEGGRGKGEGEKTVGRTSRRTGERHANWAARGVGTLPTPCLN